MASVLVLAGTPPAAKTVYTVRETVFSKGSAYEKKQSVRTRSGRAGASILCDPTPQSRSFL
jgi:hypothetical protein